jgi:CheY-specific phosphatase CheX
MPVAYAQNILGGYSEATSTVRKEVLLVEPNDPAFSGLVPLLSDLAFNVTRLGDAGWVEQIIKGAPPYALVCVDGSAIEEDLSKTILAAIDDCDITVPLLWLSSKQEYASSSLNIRKTDAVLTRPCSPQLLEAKFLRLLKTRFFPEEVRDIFVDSVTKALAENFQKEMNVVNSYLKADPLALGPVSAMVSFVGENCNGCVTVSGLPDFFVKTHERLVPGLEAPPPGEVAGEMANTITGGFKAALSHFGLTLRHSFPIIVEGHPISLAYGGPGRLALVQTISDEVGDVHIELCLDVFAPLPDRAEEADVLEEGEINFF